MSDYGRTTRRLSAAATSGFAQAAKARSPSEASPPPAGTGSLHAVLNAASAVQAVAQLKRSLNRGSVVQRLSVQGTDWSRVRAISASSAGAGGVLFMSDGSDAQLVVKPGVPADEELAAAHAHAAVANQGGFGKWKIKALGSRMAVAHDVAGIRIARDRVERASGPLNARAGGLVAALAAGTTLIQEAAAGGSSSIAEQMGEQAADRHILTGAARTGSNKDKVKSESPLKPLMKNDTNYSRSLGRLAATDLLLGNFDRIVEAANLENILLNKSKKALYPIDNTGGTAVARLLANGGGNVANPVWTGHRLAAMFIARNYAAVAADVWAMGAGAPAVTTFANELLEGFIGPVGARVFNVDAAERPGVRAKLQNHVAHIQAAFAEGLRAGRDELVAAGGIPAASGVSQAARDQYAARLALI